MLLPQRLNPEGATALRGFNPKGTAHCLVRNGDNPDDLRVVLNGSTGELQKFIGEHLNTEGAWKAGIDLRPESPAFDVGPAHSR